MTGAEQLRRLRINRGLSLRAAAKEMGVHHTILLRAEKGSTPQPRHALPIARFYGLQVTDLWPLPEEAAA